MKHKLIHLLTGLTLVTALGVNVATAQVPELLSYQGQIALQGQGGNYTGNGDFKFVMHDGQGNSLWSNDGTSANAGEPQTAVTLSVDKGFFSLLLGDTALNNMEALPVSVFQQGSDVFLRVWFNDGNNGFQQLNPDQRLASVAFAMVSGNAEVAPGSIDSSDLANNAVQSGNIAPNAVGSAQLQDNLTLGNIGTDGSLTLYGDPGLALRHAASGAEVARLGSGLLSNVGGYLNLRNPSGETRIRMVGGIDQSYCHFYQGNNLAGVSIDGSYGGNAGGGMVRVNQGDGNIGVSIRGDSSGAGWIDVRNASGSPRVSIDGQGSGNSGEIILTDKYGHDAVRLRAHNGNNILGGAEVVLSSSNNDPALRLSTSLGGAVSVYAPDGSVSASMSGIDGRTTTRILQITGGSDLSEQFDINSDDGDVEPGTLVCVDPVNPGKLVTSRKAHDATVAGIVSGAGGVNTGMVMGQTGSIADGKYPVALTGRVYCKVDAAYGAIRPGDLITTSGTPGHGMKVSDPSRAPGTVIGKAMSGLDNGTGLVLVLVSLQ